MVICYWERGGFIPCVTVVELWTIYEAATDVVVVRSDIILLCRDFCLVVHRHVGNLTAQYNLQRTRATGVLVQSPSRGVVTLQHDEVCYIVLEQRNRSCNGGDTGAYNHDVMVMRRL